MVHDPISLIEGKTYEDSVLIPLSHLKCGIIKGSEIIFDEGTYTFTYNNGTMSLCPNHVKISLYTYDTVENKRQLSEFSWNG